jgi:VanZ family protein
MASPFAAGVVKLVDAGDSKSPGVKPVPVRFRPPAPQQRPTFGGLFVFLNETDAGINWPVGLMRGVTSGPHAPLLFWRLAFWTCAAVVLVLALLPADALMPSTGWDKANHALAFAVLGFLGLRSHRSAAWTVLLSLLAYGGAIELLQGWFTVRTPDLTDLLADAVGLVAALAPQGWRVIRSRTPRAAD